MARRALTQSEKVLFIDLANAHYKGQCYLCGDIDTLKELSQQVSEIYGIIMQRYAEGRAAMETVQKTFILSYASDMSILPDILQQNGNYQFISVQTTIQENWQLRECVLIGENLNDCDFYQVVAKWYSRQRGLAESSIHFQQMGGGGQTVGNTLENCVKAERRPTLCLVDSDQKYGETKSTRGQLRYGGTYHQAAEVSKSLTQPNFPPHELCRLDVHEVENLIPTQILQELQKNSPSMDTGLQLLKRLQTVHNGAPALYYDYKNGFPYIIDKPARAYWQEIIGELGGREEDMPVAKKLETGEYDPDALFFKAIRGNSLLKQATSKMNKVEWKVDPYLIPLWEKIGAAMLSWGFAAPPTYA